LLQALIVGRMRLRAAAVASGPPAEYQVTAFNLTEAGVERAVTLPYFSPLRNAMNDPPRFTGRFVRPAGRSRAGLVGVSAALHQRRRGHRQRTS
jgi:hypothetical protein